MSTKAQSDDYPLNGLRWLVVIALAVGGVVANAVYGDFPLLYRVLALLVLAVAALWLAANTQQGAPVWFLVKESQTEVRKVIWPTRPEINQTTLIVVVLVVVTAIILWGLDSLFGWIASLIIG